MVSFKCRDIGIDSDFVATADNVQELDEKVAQYFRESQQVENLDKEMWMKIHRAER